MMSQPFEYEPTMEEDQLEATQAMNCKYPWQRQDQVRDSQVNQFNKIRSLQNVTG